LALSGSRMDAGFPEAVASAAPLRVISELDSTPASARISKIIELLKSCTPRAL